MEVKPYKLKDGSEITLARQPKEPYVFFYTMEKYWCNGMCPTFAEYNTARKYAEEIDWLELLVITGISRERAVKIWQMNIENVKIGVPRGARVFMEW